MQASQNPGNTARVAAKSNSRSNASDAQRQEILIRAKTMLMARNKWDEPQAHRFLQKKSMDCRKSLVQIAESLLLSDELLSGS